MRKFIYPTAWVMFVIIAFFNETKVSSFDIMHLCSQPNLRSNNVSLPVNSKLESEKSPYTHYLRHAVRI